MKNIITFLFILFVCIQPLLKPGDTLSLPGYQIQKINTKLIIDGILDEEAWLNSEKYGIEYEFQPSNNKEAAQKTVVRLLYDDEFLYFSFECRDTAIAKIRSNVSDRDRIFSDDFVGLILDTYGDSQFGYELFVNPHGIQGDILREGNREDDSYDMVWYSAAKMSKSGWVVEMAIPFQSIRYDDEHTKNWRVMFLRNYPRDTRYIFASSPIDRDNPCFTCHSGYLLGIGTIERKINYEVLPYLTGSQSSQLTDYENPAPGLVDGKIKGRVGSSFKIKPTPSLAIEGVVNPDFSQVESDAQQISVNSTFALFYQEKRPFFFEGSEIYRMPIHSFYSRTINDPVAATKITGKSGSLSYGFLSAYDRNSPLIIPGGEGSAFINSGLGSLTNVARVRYTGTQNNYLGGFLSTRNFKDAPAFMGAVDWSLLFWTNFYLKGQVSYSAVKELNRPDIYTNSRKYGNRKEDATLNGESLDGTGATVRLERQATNHYMDLYIHDHSPAFSTPVGFQNRNNTRAIEFENGYQHYIDSGFVNRFYVFFRTGLDFNHENIRKERWGFLGFNVNFKGNSYAFLGYLPLNEEYFKGVDMRGANRIMFELGSTPVRGFDFGLEGGFGNFIFRGDNPEIGTGHEFGLRIGIKAFERLNAEFSFNRAGLRSKSTKDLFYDGYIVRSTLSYQFSPEMFIRVISDYNSFSDQIGVFPLFSYKVNPFTIFYFGSTSNFHEYDSPLGYKPTSRQFFLKLQYLFSNTSVI